VKVGGNTKDRTVAVTAEEFGWGREIKRGKKGGFAKKKR